MFKKAAKLWEGFEKEEKPTNPKEPEEPKNIGLENVNTNIRADSGRSRLLEFRCVKVKNGGENYIKKESDKLDAIPELPHEKIEPPARITYSDEITEVKCEDVKECKKQLWTEKIVPCEKKKCVKKKPATRAMEQKRKRKDFRCEEKYSCECEAS